MLKYTGSKGEEHANTAEIHVSKFLPSSARNTCLKGRSLCDVILWAKVTHSPAYNNELEGAIFDRYQHMMLRTQLIIYDKYL